MDGHVNLWHRWPKHPIAPAKPVLWQGRGRSLKTRPCNRLQSAELTVCSTAEPSGLIDVSISQNLYMVSSRNQATDEPLKGLLLTPACGYEHLPPAEFHSSMWRGKRKRTHTLLRDVNSWGRKWRGHVSDYTLTFGPSPTDWDTGNTFLIRGPTTVSKFKYVRLTTL